MQTGKKRFAVWIVPGLLQAQWSRWNEWRVAAQQHVAGALGDREEEDSMYFQNLDQIVASLEADETTKDDPIKRTFVVDGTHLTANVGIVRDSGNALHTQKHHDELLVIIQGNVAFRVGDEVKTVTNGDLVFIPQNTLHGPILEEGQSFAALSIFAPYFDKLKKNIEWDRDSA